MQPTTPRKLRRTSFRTVDCGPRCGTCSGQCGQPAPPHAGNDDPQARIPVPVPASSLIGTPMARCNDFDMKSFLIGCGALGRIVLKGRLHGRSAVFALPPCLAVETWLDPCQRPREITFCLHPVPESDNCFGISLFDEVFKMEGAVLNRSCLLGLRSIIQKPTNRSPYRRMPSDDRLGLSLGGFERRGLPLGPPLPTSDKGAREKRARRSPVLCPGPSSIRTHFSDPSCNRTYVLGTSSPYAP